MKKVHQKGERGLRSEQRQLIERWCTYILIEA